MKKIIPFVKELNFKTKVSEITSISLEHNITLKDNDLISGVFHISGDYKMTEGSINREQFNFNLPFDIALDARYDTNNCTIDIDNFYYEIINNDILKVNIDLYIEGELMKEETKEKEKEIKEEIKEDVRDKQIVSEIKEIKPIIPTIEEERESETAQVITPVVLTEEEPRTEENTNINVNANTNTNTNTNSLFDNVSGSETYATYHVYIVKEEDTIDKILTKYGVTKEDLENYNDISSIKPGDKLVVPSINNLNG